MDILDQRMNDLKDIIEQQAELEEHIQMIEQRIKALKESL